MLHIPNNYNMKHIRRLHTYILVFFLIIGMNSKTLGAATNCNEHRRQKVAWVEENKWNNTWTYIYIYSHEYYQNRTKHASPLSLFLQINFTHLQTTLKPILKRHLNRFKNFFVVKMRKMFITSRTRVPSCKKWFAGRKEPGHVKIQGHQTNTGQLQFRADPWEFCKYIYTYTDQIPPKKCIMQVNIPFFPWILWVVLEMQFQLRFAMPNPL